MLTHTPRKGSFVRWPGGSDSRPYEVLRTDERICWIQRPGEKPTCFIFVFTRDGYNVLAIHCDKDGNELDLKNEAVTDG